MASPLRRTLTRRVIDFGGRVFFVTLTQEGIMLREKYAKQGYLLPYRTAHVKAVDLAVGDRRPKRRRR